MVSALLERLRRIEEARTRVIYPWELPSIMRKHIITGAMGTVYLALISGMFLVAFGSELGLEQWQWGLLSSGASLMLVFQLLSAYIVGCTGTRRSLWFTAALVSRLLRGVAIGVAFWLSGPMPAGARTIFILLLVLASAFDAVAAPPWFSWLADIIPEEQHGHFMGRRGAWSALANVCVVVPMGYVLDRVPEGHAKLALLLMFAFATIVGVLDLLIHNTIPVPPMRMAPRQQFWHAMATPLRDRRFRPWLLFNALWTFSMTLGGALAMVYFVEDLGIRRRLLGGSVVLIMLPRVGTILTGRYLGSLVDRYGIKKTLWWGYRLWAILPAFWLLATPRSAMWWLGAAAVAGGLASTLAITAAGKLTTRLPGREHVAMYVAVSTCVGSLAGAGGPALAALILYLLRDFSWSFAGRTFVAFHIIFVASFVLRNLSTVIIRRIPEPSTPGRPSPGASAPGAPPARRGDGP